MSIILSKMPLVDRMIHIFMNFDRTSKRLYYKYVNDVVFCHNDVVMWTFHNNHIAKQDYVNNTLTVSLAGWPTMSTMTRLNNLLYKFGSNKECFKGYGNSRFLAHPTFCGTPIEVDEEIILELPTITKILNL